MFCYKKALKSPKPTTHLNANRDPDFIATFSGRSHAVPEVVVSRAIGDRNDDSSAAGDARGLKTVISVLSPV